MTKFKKKPVVIEATRWHKNGDHPQDGTESSGGPGYMEGRVVRYFRRPDRPGEAVCMNVGCGQIMHNHGWIDTLEGGHVVCPGDWIITGVAGEMYSCKNVIFEATYEAVTL